MRRPWTRSGRQVQRMHQIAEVLLRHGLGYVAAQIGLPLDGGPKPAPTKPESLPSQVREALQELGPTYVKLGQMLSTRPDILPPDWIEELSLLQDRVPPVPIEQAQAVVEAELGAPVDQLFRNFDPVPIGSASIGQVHRADLITGEPVVVKVQRPNVREYMDDDLEVMREVARLAEGRTAWGKVYSPTALVEQFGRELHEQLDYTVEGRHAGRARAVLSGDSEVLVPDVYWTYSTAKVLTLEYMQGTRLSEVIGGQMSPEGRRRLAIVLVRSLLRQVYRDGMYHADPHPGNLLLTLDGRLALMDFGLVGFLDEGLRDAVAGLSLGLVQRDSEEIALAVQDLGMLTRPVPQRALQRDIQYLLYQYYDRPMNEIPFAEMVQQVLSIAIKYGVQVPPELGQFVRTLITLEGVVRQLDPNLSVVDLADPVIEELRHERYSADQIAGDLRRSALLAARQLNHMPARIRAFLQRLEGGQLPVIIEHGDFEHNLPHVSRLVNRLVASIMVASTLLLAGLLLGLDVGPAWGGLSVLGLSILTAGILGCIWLLRAILRSGEL
jgi:ubiquinone biosynthesis protein